MVGWAVGFPARLKGRRVEHPAGGRNAMTLADAQQQRVLDRLRQSGNQPVAFADLRNAGIAFPAVVISELELHGYVIERVYEHGRLVGVRRLQPEDPDTPALRRRPWQHR